MMITARDPDGATNPTPFDVEITLKQVNEAPKVTQYDETAMADLTDEISTVCIKENRDLGVPDDITTPLVDESQFANVLTNNNECEVATGNYTYRAVDDDVEATTLIVITGTSRPDDNQVKLSLSGDDAAHFELVEVVDGAAGIDLPEGDAATGIFQLRFKKSEADFESPIDANKDNRYEVSVKAEDEDGLTSTKDLTVKIENMVRSLAR